VETLKQASPDLKVTHVLREGWPKEAIHDEAELWGADLIVVGSHGYGSIRRLFLGSVSFAIATNASCSVEIVRKLS
jgi:nucleotide-binding universal stress UspA family protein